MRKKRLLRGLIATLLLWGILASCAGASGLPEAKDRSQMVRVYLTRLALSDRLDVTLKVAYRLTTGLGTEMQFQPGSELTFLKSGRSIYLYYEGMALGAGGSVLLERAEADGQALAGFSIPHEEAVYPGDLFVDIVQDRLRPILTLHVEKYLLGVVPYEMSDSFPLEALKAQAVAARTYVLRRQDAQKEYDVVDNTNDQVYRGCLPGNVNAERAVLQTAGICGFYKGRLAQCYYAASNGGRMEAVRDVWPSDGDYSYYAVGEDPYDVANPFSEVRRYALQKHYEGDDPQTLRGFLCEAMARTLQERGYDFSPDGVRIDGVKAAEVEENTVHLTLRVSARTRRVVLPVADTDPEEVSLFQVGQETARPLDPEPSAAPQPTVFYGAFEALLEDVELYIPIFPTAETAFGMDISAHLQNEVWTVAENRSSFVLEARRFGHGVGMSQRGAQWMAAAHGKTFREILAFYYPGMQLMQYAPQAEPVARPDAMLEHTPGPAPTPTPRPTPVPLTQRPEAGERLAEVTEISAESSLNLRAEPSLSAEVLTRLYKGQRLIVEEACAEVGWVKVRINDLNGYVMEEFLTYLSK